MNKNLGKINFCGREISQEQPPYIIAEMSANHNGNLNTALEIISEAKKCGADAVKIQTYKAETITINHDNEEFYLQTGLWKGKKLFDLYDQAHTPWEWHTKLFDHAKGVGITLFSSPFDETAVDFLEKLNCPAYKIASPELIDLPLIEKVAKTGKPVIMSTGMANLEEISEAITTARNANCKKLILLHCTSAYPSTIKDANLSTIKEISKKFDVITGLSDHTNDTKTSVIATALGAVMIEKHFILDKSEETLDSKFSIDPIELKKLVYETKEVREALGNPAFGPIDSEKLILGSRRSLYSVQNISKGDLFTKNNIKSIRPGKGLKPKYFSSVIGKKASRDISYGEPLSFEMIEDQIF